MKIFGKIRYLFLSHQVPTVGQNTKIYVQLLLSILDAVNFLIILDIFTSTSLIRT